MLQAGLLLVEALHGLVADFQNFRGGEGGCLLGLDEQVHHLAAHFLRLGISGVLIPQVHGIAHKGLAHPGELVLQLEELQQPLGALSQSALAGLQAAHHFLNFGNVRLPGFLVGVQIGGGPGVLGIQFAPLGNFLLHKKISSLFRIHKCCRENLARRARAALKDGQAPDTNKR